MKQHPLKNPDTEPERGPFWGYILSAPRHHLSDAYLFADWKHAADWMAQPLIASTPGYAVHPAVYRRKACCGKITAIKRGVQMLRSTKDGLRCGP